MKDYASCATSAAEGQPPTGRSLVSAGSFRETSGPTSRSRWALFSQRLERTGIALQRSIDDRTIAGASTPVVWSEQISWCKEQGGEDQEVGKAA
jgi:hypothetical protein